MYQHAGEWWGYAAAFLLIALVQGGSALALWRSPRQRLLLFNVYLNLAVLAAYVASRTAGVPFFGPHAGHAEAVGAVDMVAAAAEMGVILILTAILSRDAASPAVRTVLAALTLTFVVAGAWHLAQPGPGPAPLSVGEPVALGTGSLRVDRVLPEQMAPMNMGQFASSGMQMSSSVPDMTPHGLSRFIVEVTLDNDGDSPLRYSTCDFRVGGTGLSPVRPLRSELPEGVLLAGHSVSGSLVFQVPEGSEDLLLRMRGAARAVALPDEAAHAHGHGEEESGEGLTEGHPHGTGAGSARSFTVNGNSLVAAAFLLLLAAAVLLAAEWPRIVAALQPRTLAMAGAGASLMIVVVIGAADLLPRGASVSSALEPTSCAAIRSYDVVAISVDLPFNRWGDHNPNGQIYVLEQDRLAVKNWYVPLGRDAEGNLDPALDPAGAGNRRLRPRPLVLRANEGECVQVTFRNDLNPTPGEGLTQNPRASIHVHGASFDVQTSDGSRVGWNADTTVGIGETVTYLWRAPVKEGLDFFHDHGNTAGSEADGGSNSHGLYGGFVVEPAGSIWIDPVSGRRLYEETGNQNGELYISAIIVPPAAQGAAHDGSIPDLHEPNTVAFRETIQISQDEIPGDHSPLFPQFTFGMGLGFNYGTEPLLLRQEPINRCPDCVGEETWLSSWPYGDPALVKLASGQGPWLPPWHPLFPGNNGEQVPGRVEDPEDCGLELMPADLWNSCFTSNVTRAYKFDATKIRFAHAGTKETHVFHMHAHQWLADPFDVGNSGSTPGQPGAPAEDPHNVNLRRPESVTIDSQTFGPGETFTADLLFGAGSKPGTTGDSIFHCHLYPHFAEGFWALARVHDVAEDGAGTTPDGVNVTALVPLPDRTAAGDLPPPPDEFNPGYPRFLPGEFGWRAPQPLGGISEQNGAADIPNTVEREDLQSALRIVAGKALDQDLLEKTQSIAIEDADGGTFTLTFDGQTTGPITYNAPAADVESALEGLPNTVDVSVGGSGSAGDPWRVKLGLWSQSSSLILSADGAGLTNSDPLIIPSITVTPDPELEGPDAAAIAYRMAVERHVSLLNYNAGYDPTNPPPDLKLPKPGAPNEDPCPPGAREVTYSVSIIQLDIVYNEAGWHDTQGRVLVLDKDVDAVLAGTKRPEPLFFRVNAGDCINFNLTNRLPNWLGNDDFLKLIQTNMVGQHIHLVKFDVKGSDGASNGWNPQQAAFSRAQQQFDAAILSGAQSCGPDTFNGMELVSDGCRIPTPASFDPAWTCSSLQACPAGQTIHERWYADYELRTVFTHDHHFPAEDQNRGYFGALVVEPLGMDIRNSFSGEFLQPINNPAHGPVCGAACVGTAVGTHLDIIGPEANDDFREFSLGVQDFVALYRPCAEPPCSSVFPGEQALNPPLEPEEYPDDDPGVFGVNYRNAPFLLRDKKDGVPVDPAYRFSSWVFGDPDTPLLQAYAGDPIRVRLIQGSQEEQHVVQIHGMRWREEPDDPGSPFVNAKSLGISEAFNFEIPRMECGVDEDCRGDYLYSTTSTDDLWLGVWGILRVYGKGKQGLLPLPDNIPQATNGQINFTPTGAPPPMANKPGTPCPTGAPVRAYRVIAVDAPITYNEFGHNDPYGLVYAVVLPGETPADAAARVRSTNPEPMVLRANEGDCIEVTLTNMIDPAGPFAIQHAPLGAADGDPPLVLEPPAGTPAGLRVSLHPALLLYDIRGSDGATVGFNRDQTVGPGQSILYRWYADDVTPGELGTINLTDYGDVRGHRHHGLFAGLNVEPANATYHDPFTGDQIWSGAQADIRVPGQEDFREFTVFFQDGLNLRDENGIPLPDHFDHPPTPEEPEGELPDAEDRGEKGLNYRNASFNPRLNVTPGAPLDDLNGADMAYVFSSEVHGDPMTPIFRAYATDAVRMRVLQGSDKPRQHAFQLSGHSWFRQPFDDPAETEVIGIHGGFSVGRAANIHLQNAGGPEENAGDHKYSCAVGFHHQSGGLWGIMRVYHAPVNPPPIFVPDPLRNGDSPGTADNPHDPDYQPLMPLEQVQINARVYNDSNMNGQRGATEAGVGGVQTQLYPPDGTVPLEGGTKLTGPDGKAVFHAAPGAYDARFTLPPDPTKPAGSDWAATTPVSYRVDATTQFERPYGEFGMVRLADVTVVVFDDKDGDNIQDSGESGHPGWTVTLSGGRLNLSSPTNSGGAVKFDGLKPGTYSVNVAAEAGWHPNPLLKLPFSVSLSEDASATSMAGFARKAGLSVKLYNDSNANGVQDQGESSLQDWKVSASSGAGGNAEGHRGGHERQRRGRVR